MISRRIMRVSTSLAVIALCAWPVWKGSDLIRFAVARSGFSPAQAVQPWFNDSGVAFDAREIALTPTDDSSNDETIRKRRDQLIGILANRPLSSFYWLQLAQTRLANNEPMDAALADFEMSVITGPNEEYMITQRALFGIWQWEAVPPNIQQRSITDLTTVTLSDAKLAWLKTTLTDKPAQVRQQIQDALRDQGMKGNTLERMGLSVK
jgi:hypothetical protein